MLTLFGAIGDVQVRDREEGRIELDVELPCEPASGLGSALRAAAKGLVSLRP
jgi:hypothetical protein